MQGHTEVWCREGCDEICSFRDKPEVAGFEYSVLGDQYDWLRQCMVGSRGYLRPDMRVPADDFLDIKISITFEAIID